MRQGDRRGGAQLAISDAKERASSEGSGGVPVPWRSARNRALVWSQFRLQFWRGGRTRSRPTRSRKTSAARFHVARRAQRREKEKQTYYFETLSERRPQAFFAAAEHFKTRSCSRAIQQFSSDVRDTSKRRKLRAFRPKHLPMFAKISRRTISFCKCFPAPRKAWKVAQN